MLHKELMCFCMTMLLASMDLWLCEQSRYYSNMLPHQQISTFLHQQSSGSDDHSARQHAAELNSPGSSALLGANSLLFD